MGEKDLSESIRRKAGDLQQCLARGGGNVCQLVLVIGHHASQQVLSNFWGVPEAILPLLEGSSLNQPLC